MLDRIKQLSSQAQDMIDSQIKNGRSLRELTALKTCYRQLNLLIEAGERQSATFGLLIMSRHLQQTAGADALNAAQLLENFFQVVDLPSETSFGMSKKSLDMTCLDNAKLLTALPFMFMAIMIAVLPLAFLSPLAWLFLLISALPLLITYAFDQRFSMSRWYQEMAGIEHALSILILTLGLISIVAVLPHVTLVQATCMLMSTLGSGAGLFYHAQHLTTKYNSLMSWQQLVRDGLNPSRRYLEQQGLLQQGLFKPKNTSDNSGLPGDDNDILGQLKTLTC